MESKNEGSFIDQSNKVRASGAVHRSASPLLVDYYFDVAGLLQDTDVGSTIASAERKSIPTETKSGVS